MDPDLVSYCSTRFLKQFSARPQIKQTTFVVIGALSRSKAVLLLWICVSCLSIILSCLFFAVMGHLLGKG